jgi:iron(III) transport system substrate-binding protein
VRKRLALAALLLAACSPEPPPTLVIYAPSDAEEDLRQRLSGGEFSVDIVGGDAAELTDSIIARQDSPRADVLVTGSVVDIWRAADLGALRPLPANVVERVHPQHRDPDGAWAALGHEAALIGMMPGAPDAEVSTYMDLGSEKLAGHLCLTSIDQPRNRVLISMLIEDLGPKPAERAVRLWMRNLAAPPFDDEAELAAALRSGTCHVAVISAKQAVEGLVHFAPKPVYSDIRGIGVTRHAEHPEEAARLVAWLLESAPGPGYSNGRHVGVAGWRDEEARLLAERVGYR